MSVKASCSFLQLPVLPFFPADSRFYLKVLGFTKFCLTLHNFPYLPFLRADIKPECKIWSHWPSRALQWPVFILNPFIFDCTFSCENKMKTNKTSLMLVLVQCGRFSFSPGFSSISVWNIFLHLKILDNFLFSPLLENGLHINFRQCLLWIIPSPVCGGRHFCHRCFKTKHGDTILGNQKHTKSPNKIKQQSKS